MKIIQTATIRQKKQNECAAIDTEGRLPRGACAYHHIFLADTPSATIRFHPYAQFTRVSLRLARMLCPAQASPRRLSATLADAPVV